MSYHDHYRVTQCNPPILGVSVQGEDFGHTLIIEFNNSGRTRHDLIVLEGNRLSAIVGTRTVPACPTNAIPLASVEVPTNVTCIGNHLITDRRQVDARLDGTTPYGFAWGPIQVERTAEIDESVFIRVKTTAGKELHIYSSPQGRSLRVFSGGKELK